MPSGDGDSEGSSAGSLLRGLRTLLKRTEALSGEEAILALLTGLATLFDAKLALLGVQRRDKPEVARARWVVADGEVAAPFEYALAGTPCAEVCARGEPFLVKRDAAAQFPDDPHAQELGLESYAGVPLRRPGGHPMGTLAVLHTGPLEDAEALETALLLLSPRFVAELDALRNKRRERERDTQLELALNAARMFAWHWSKETGLTFTGGTQEVLGVAAPPPETTADETAKLLHREDRAAYLANYAGMMAGRHDRCAHEYRVTGDDGVERSFREHAVARRGRDGSVESISGIAADISERRRAADQLALAARVESLGRLAGGVAHDFNNLLTAILSHVELGDEATTLEEAVAQLAPIRGAALRARRLTRQLLSYARRQRVQADVFLLPRLVDDLERIIEGLTGAPIRVERTSEGDAQPVLADKGQIEHVVLNLVVNARDAMPLGGRLRVHTEPRTLSEEQASEAGVLPGDYAALVVEDDGEGMTPDVLARAFDPFFTTKGPDKGTGLGLAAALGVVSQAGGGLLLESEPGQGTRATLLLPVRPDAVLVPSSRPPPPVPAKASGSILVVEDEDGVRRVMVRHLRRRGYTVRGAATVAEALRLVDEAAPDLAVTDMVLPDGTGGELALALRDRVPGLPIVQVSGYSEETLEGSRDIPFLAKPFTPKELAAVVARTLSKSAAPR
ncbi:MAG: ATP-binding protein [Myxococcota bacterium]